MAPELDTPNLEGQAIDDALGLLAPEEARSLEAALAEGDPNARAAHADARQVADALLLATPPVEPSLGARKRLLARIAEDARSGDQPRPTSPTAPRGAAPARHRRARRAPWIAAAGAVAAAVFAVVIGAQVGRLARELGLEREARVAAEQALEREQKLARELSERIEGEREGLQGQVVSLRRMVDSVTARRTQLLTLTGQGGFDRAYARAFLDPEQGRLLLNAYEVPVLPRGHRYQVWVIADDTPIPIGAFDGTDAGAARYDVTDLPLAARAGEVVVTIEPAEPPATHPTGPVVLSR